MCRRDNFITGLQAQPAHRDVKSVRPVGTGNTMLYFESSSPALFESFDMFASNESRLRDHFSNRGVNFLLNSQVLRAEIDERDFHKSFVMGRRKWAGFPR